MSLSHPAQAACGPRTPSRFRAVGHPGVGLNGKPEAAAYAQLSGKGSSKTGCTECICQVSVVVFILF